jgi:hypothetical protein
MRMNSYRQNEGTTLGVEDASETIQPKIDSFQRGALASRFRPGNDYFATVFEELNLSWPRQDKRPGDGVDGLVCPRRGRPVASFLNYARPIHFLE